MRVRGSISTALAWADRFRDCLFRSHAAEFYSTDNRSLGAIQTPSPVRYVKSLAVRRDPFSRNPIGVLLLPRRPPNVPRNIAPTRIREAIKRVVEGGPNPHVAKEVLELQPRWVDLDPSPTITLVFVGVRIQTAAFHRAPRAVRRGAVKAVLQGKGHTTSRNPHEAVA